MLSATPQQLKRKPGRPKAELDVKKVEQLAAAGLTMEEIATCLDIHVATLYKQKAENTELDEAYKRGRAKGAAVVASKLMGQIDKGNVGAIIWYEKTRCGRRELAALSTAEVINHFGSATMELVGTDGTLIRGIRELWQANDWYQANPDEQQRRVMELVVIGLRGILQGLSGGCATRP